MKKYRNWAFHQIPKKAFSTVPEPLQSMYINLLKDKEQKRAKQKQNGLSKNSKKRKN